MQKPENGTLLQLNESTFEYSANAGYAGTYTSSAQATGKGPKASGTSIITMNARFDSIDLNADTIPATPRERCRVRTHAQA